MIQTHAPGRGVVAGALLLGSGCVSAAVTAALSVRISTPLPPAPEVDEIVARGIVGVGIVAGAWITLCCLVAALCLGVRGFGMTWRAGERAVHRFAPGAVRRALGAGVAATIAVGLATSAGAAEPVNEGPPAATMSVAVTDALPALGWEATARLAAPSDDLGWGAAAGSASRAAGTGTPATTTVAEPAASPATATAQPRRQTTAVSLPGAATAATHASAAAPTGTTASAAPEATSIAATAAPHRDRARAHASIVVRRGDSLWSIAAAHLPADATAGAVASAWPTWYQANADMIGVDPDHIVPGQRLVIPAEVANDADVAAEGSR